MRAARLNLLGAQVFFNEGLSLRKFLYEAAVAGAGPASTIRYSPSHLWRATRSSAQGPATIRELMRQACPRLPARPAPPPRAAARVTLAAPQLLEGVADCHARNVRPPAPPIVLIGHVSSFPRTKRTRLVRPPVLSGHVSSVPSY